MYLSAISVGSPEGRVKVIMEYSSYEEMDSHYTDTIVEEIYKVTDIDYINFTNKLSSLYQGLVNNICSYFKSRNIAFKEYNGKLAVHQGGWTGTMIEFVSQKLVLNNDNKYVWEVVISSTSDEDTYRVTGKVENGKYILVSVEEQ